MAFSRRPTGVSRALQTFVRIESASSLLLLAATLCALLWANSPWSASYESLWHAESSRLLINDVLMTAFFLIVGLEIRREAHDGALSSLRTAALPVAAALGGIIAPATIYLLVSSGEEARAGWAIPTATDIAFAVGALALLGKRVGAALRAPLLALAIADDVAAIVIIALFYSHGVSLWAIGIVALGFAALGALRLFRVQRAAAYLVAGAVLWIGLLLAHLHPVLAGVAVGMLMPVGAASALEKTLHPWVAFGVMPLFALANAGVAFGELDLASDTARWLAVGIVLALWIGKPLGIFATAALAVRIGVCRLPEGVTWGGVALIGCLGGIGFTMSIFIATLAFPDPTLLAASKVGVLAASVLAGSTALLAGRAMRR